MSKLRLTRAAGKGYVSVFELVDDTYKLLGILEENELSKDFDFGFWGGISFRLVAYGTNGYKFYSYCETAPTPNNGCTYNYIYQRKILGFDLYYNVWFTQDVIPDTCNITIGIQEGFGRIDVSGDVTDTIFNGSKTYQMSGSSSNISFKATPASDWTFEKWCDESGTITCLGPSDTVTWTSGCTYNDRTYKAYFFKVDDPVTTQLEVKRVGNGKINVYRNEGYVGQVSNTEDKETFYFNVGDSVWLEAYPTPGTQNMFEKWCGPQGCSSPCRIVSGKCAGDLKFTISSNQTGSNARTAYFTASHKICENDQNTGIGICKDVVGAGTDECTVGGNTCDAVYHNECQQILGGVGGSTCVRVQGEGDNTCTSEEIGLSCTPTGGFGSCIIKNPLNDDECLLDYTTMVIAIIVLIVILLLIMKITS
jgi:hypothetical protein